MAASAASERCLVWLGMSWIVEKTNLGSSSVNDILFMNSARKAKKEALKLG